MSQALCTLQSAVGQVEPCPGERCPFWDEGTPPGCVVALVESELLERPHLARHLLELRADLDCARRDGEEEDAQRRFSRRRTRSSRPGRRA